MKAQINVIILGQTGVGKSARINYLFGKEVVKVISGPPGNGRDDFNKITVLSPLRPDVSINIFDSWGLESAKANDWKSVINKKLSKDKLSPDDMIFGIVYCSSYANDRVQDFEIEILKELLGKEYKIIRNCLEIS
ncbi:MAG: 50S ribosome-binding GTPase [Synergistaceae bacterium]|jgi:predicted GTPase|nr:50S ribosome-binding GTPase [Synergistaceae bacterium]